MPHSRYLAPFLLVWLAAAGPLPEIESLAPAPDAITHANHIFNAVHSSMRQFGSSLNHNGMSLFVATVPKGTELYHGTSREYRVNNTEWLAFEPEHALIFARGHRGPPPGHRPPGGGPPGEGPPNDVPDMDADEPNGPYYPDRIPDHPEPHRIGDQRKHRPGQDRPKHCGGKDGPRKGRPEKHHGDKGRPDEHHCPPRNGSCPDAPRCSPPPPPPHHRPPPPHEDPSRPHHCPPGEGHLPCRPSHEPPHSGPGHHAPPREDSGHDQPSRSPPAHGDHEYHGPPPRSFKDFLPHQLHDELGHHHRDSHEHRSSFSLPPFGFWARRLGDMLRNPKRRHAPSHSDAPATPLRSETIEARGAQGAFGSSFVEQEPMTADSPEDQKSGYLHTYRTKHDLRLLYVDGQSAAKSQKGTLDTQDVLLLDNSINHGSGMFGEKERANQMCKLAREQWGGRIDGILRMEGGFEIILCDFAAHLDVISIAKTNPNAGGGMGGDGDNGDGFNYYRAVAARYHGIGGNRVKIDYQDFVTAFAYPEAIFFDHTDRPRLNNGSASMDVLRRAVDQMVLHKDDNLTAVDWQSIADLVVARYADRIEYLASGSLTSLSSLQAEIDRALRPFIDYSARNHKSEAQRCAAQFMPGHIDATSPSVAAQAVHHVAHTLCSSLLIASAQTEYAAALAEVKQLKEYLAWTTWKQCRGCAVDEICFLPIWPVGSAEDFEQPQCRSDVSLGPGPGRRGGYWNDFDGPGGPRPGPQKRE